MKQLKLTLFFTVYNIFMPFVLLNCSTSDSAYVYDPNAQADIVPTLEDCLAETYTSEECVNIIQAAQEAEESADEAITTAYADVPEFVSCQSYIATTTTETATETPATDDPAAATDCSKVVEHVLDGFTACQALTAEERGFACAQIETRVTTATTRCAADTRDLSATDDFCALLS